MENATQNTIRQALASTRKDIPPIVLDALSLSVTRSISYDRTLRDLGDDAISRAITESGGSTEHAAIMAAIRAYADRISRTGTPQPQGAGAGTSEEMTSWGFLLQCWDCYRQHGDICSVRSLTVTFLSRWIVKKGELVERDELDWCARQAVRDAEECAPEEKERRMRAAYEEAVVLLVMDKYRRAYEKNPGRVEAFFAEKRRRYDDYSLRRFGYAPDWTPGSFRRTPATSAFAKAEEK